jgi:hypothetical protein
MNPQCVGRSLNPFKPENVFLGHAKLFGGARTKHAFAVLINAHIHNFPFA